MIDEFAKEYLHDALRWNREALVSKLDGLSEYDIRRPLTTTGTNLLGLIKHLSVSEARYFSEVFNRPPPQPLPRWDEPSAWSQRRHVGDCRGDAPRHTRPLPARM